MQVLEEHRKICEREGKFNEAEVARKRLKELRKLEDIRKRDELIMRHRTEMKALENAHKSEIKELINKWNHIIMPNFENESSLLELELKKKHQNELEEFKCRFESEGAGAKVHYSSEILNMQKKSELLGQQGFYKEAKKLKSKVRFQKSMEREKYDATKNKSKLNKGQLVLQ